MGKLTGFGIGGVRLVFTDADGPNTSSAGANERFRRESCPPLQMGPHGPPGEPGEDGEPGDAGEDGAAGMDAITLLLQEAQKCVICEFGICCIFSSTLHRKFFCFIYFPRI